MKKLSIVMAVYNEEKTVVEALTMVVNAKLSIAKEIIIVNDGSTDNSEKLILDFIQNSYENVEFKYIQKANGGKGSAVREGFKVSTGEVVIIQDGDCENNPNDYEKCITPILNGEASVVYGSRERYAPNRKHTSWGFYLGGLSVSFFFNLLYGTSITDEPTCYKTFAGDLIRNLDFEENGFGWEPEITAKVLRLGFEIAEVPIEYHPRTVAEGKKIRLKDGLRALWLTLLYFFKPISQERKKVAKNYHDDKLTIKKKSRYKDGLFIIFIVAFLVRLVLALPSLGTPENFLRLDSGGFLFTNPNFDWGARAPLYTVLLYLLSYFEGNLYFYGAISGIVLSSLCVFWAGYIGKNLSNYTGGLICALMWALNITSIGNSPLILSDTLFTFLVGLQVLFFVRLYKRKRLIDFAYGSGFAVLACLVRIVNLPFVLIVIPILGILYLEIKWKMILGIIGNYALVAVFLLPFMYWNLQKDATFTLEYNSMLALTHNSSAVIAHATKRDSNEILTEEQKLVNEFIEVRKPTIRERNEFIKNRYFEVIKKYPKSFVLTHIPQVLIMLPDLPSVCENMKLSVGGKGTLGVIRRDGVVAGVRHYFASGSGGVMIILLSPLLLLTLIGYIGCFFELCKLLWQKKLLLIVLWGALSLYYVVLPGPVIMPRYHLPALFMIFALGAKFFVELFTNRKKI